MASIPRDGLGGIFDGRTYEEPQVARYITVAGSDDGFIIPSGDPALNDVHLQGIHAPGLVPGIPAVLYFRTQHWKGSQISVRLNSTTLFRYTAPADGAQSWHEIIEPHVLKEQDNELTLAVSTQDQVAFSEIVILYTSKVLTVTRPVVLDPLG